MTSGVYVITHLPSGLRYVGASLNPQQRIRHHLSPGGLYEHWRQRLPEGRSTPIAELRATTLELIDDSDRDQAERDWWFLLKPELNAPGIPTMRGCAGGRLIKKSTADEMRLFIQKAMADGLRSDEIRSLWDPKPALWRAVVDLMEQGARKRRGHLLEALP